MYVCLALTALVLIACGKDADKDAGTSTILVEVGDGQPGLHIAEASVESDGTVSEAEVKQCADVFSTDVQGWKISGNQNQVDLQPSQAFATKVTGNRNNLNIIIKAKEGETGVVSFPGLCLVLAGNQPTVNVSLESVSLETFKVIANGNKGTLNITLKADAAIPEGTSSDLGKHVTVTVTEESKENDQ
jgi:hypothetical protein